MQPEPKYQTPAAERWLETLLFASRWLMAQFYVGWSFRWRPSWPSSRMSSQLTSGTSKHWREPPSTPKPWQRQPQAFPRTAIRGEVGKLSVG
jgi:hypothetical protein